MRHQGTNCSCSLVFFLLLLRLWASVYIWSDIYPTWEILGLPLYVLFFFFLKLCKCSCLHLPCVYHWLLWTPTAEKCQVLYVALCLCVGKAPLIWVSVEPQGAAHPVGEVLMSWNPFSRLTNLTQHPLRKKTVTLCSYTQLQVIRYNVHFLLKLFVLIQLFNHVGACCLSLWSILYYCVPFSALSVIIGRFEMKFFFVCFFF